MDFDIGTFDFDGAADIIVSSKAFFPIYGTSYFTSFASYDDDSAGFIKIDSIENGKVTGEFEMSLPETDDALVGSFDFEYFGFTGQDLTEKK